MSLTDAAGKKPVTTFAPMEGGKVIAADSKYPITTSQGVMDIEDNIHTFVAGVMDDDLIQMCQYIQYANQFDEINSARSVL